MTVGCTLLCAVSLPALPVVSDVVDVPPPPPPPPLEIPLMYE
jgi:hypothetical protein